MTEKKTLKLSSGALGSLVALAGYPYPLALAEDIDLDYRDATDVCEVPIVWMNLDGDLRQADVDARLLSDWKPPEPRKDSTRELIAFLEQMIGRFGPPPRDAEKTSPTTSPPAWGLWPEVAPGEGPESLRAPAPGESVARTEDVLGDPGVQCAMAAAAGVRVATESQNFTSDDPRAPWNKAR